MSRHTQIFLSYARDDGSKHVERLRSYLKSGGTEAWVDVSDIPAGVDWSDEIETAIAACDAFLLLLTPKSAVSENVQREFRVAQQWQKQVVPLLFGGMEPPEWLKRTECLKFPKIDDKTLAKLNGDLRKVWDRVERRLDEVRYSMPADDLAPLLEHLRSVARGDPFPRVRPEALMACAELVARMSADQRERNLVDLVTEWREGGYVKPDWTYYTAYQAHKPIITKVLKEAFKGVPIQEPKDVPFVLVVMTDKEAQELESETVFEGEAKALDGHYRTILKMMKEKGVDDWASRYRARPELWRPFDGTEAGSSLAQLIASELQPASATASGELRRARFVDIRTVNDSPELLADLRRNGCVVVLDVVSICHPHLMLRYRQSLLDVFPSTFLLKMGPLAPMPVFGKEEKHITTVPFVQRIDSFFYERMSAIDPHCGVASEELEFRRFMREKVNDLFFGDRTRLRSQIKREAR